MAQITGFTADRMLEIENASIIDGEIIGDHLILTKHDGTQIDAGVVVGPAGPAGPAGTGWMTGDYKISALSADHADPSGGQWLLCNGGAIDTGYTELISLIGANRPDAQGRTLAMLGTHADVNALLDSDGLAVGSRTPKHSTTGGGTTGTGTTGGGTSGTDTPDHSHSFETRSSAGSVLNIVSKTGTTGGTDPMSTGGASARHTHSIPGLSIPALSLPASFGPAGTRPADTPAYIVPGNLFIHT